MSTPLFLYNFTKIYVPGALLLCLFFAVSNYTPPAKPSLPARPQTTAPLQQQRLPKPPPVQAERDSQVKTPAKPRYTYMVELTSGGTMKAKGYKLNENQVTIIVDKGYEVKLSKRDIKSIQRIKL